MKAFCVMMCLLKIVNSGEVIHLTKRMQCCAEIRNKREGSFLKSGRPSSLPSEVLTDVTDETLPVESYTIYKQVEFDIISCISSYLQNSAQHGLHKYAAKGDRKIHGTLPADICKCVLCLLNTGSLMLK